LFGNDMTTPVRMEFEGSEFEGGFWDFRRH